MTRYNIVKVWQHVWEVSGRIWEGLGEVVGNLLERFLRALGCLECFMEVADKSKSFNSKSICSKLWRKDSEADVRII